VGCKKGRGGRSAKKWGGRLVGSIEIGREKKRGGEVNERRRDETKKKKKIAREREGNVCPSQHLPLRGGPAEGGKRPRIPPNQNWEGEGPLKKAQRLRKDLQGRGKGSTTSAEAPLIERKNIEHSFRGNQTMRESPAEGGRILGSTVLVSGIEGEIQRNMHRAQKEIFTEGFRVTAAGTGSVLTLKVRRKS